MKQYEAVMLKYCDLQDFYTKMFIVADSKRSDEFRKKLHYEGFRSLCENKRVDFLSYDRLMAIYYNVVQHKANSLLY